jgi:hypothetical protein
VERKEIGNGTFTLHKPAAAKSRLERVTLDIARQSATRNLLKQVSETVTVEAGPDTIDLYTAATELAAIYRLNVWTAHEELKRLYTDEVPAAHLASLARQIEEQTCKYELREETVEVALALVRPEGFERTLNTDGTEVYTAEISYPIDREKLLLQYEEWRGKWDGKAAEFGFHYTPYNLDSNPEKSFFEQVLESIGENPANVEDIYFTGALTDPRKTDFYVEYKDEDGKWHRYTPDFIIRKKDGKCLIVEIKAERDRNHAVNGEKGRKAVAIRQWEKLNPDRLKYQMIFVDGDVITRDQTQTAREFVK